MKKIILLSIVSLSTFLSSAQCAADFTWSVSGSTVQLTNTSSGLNNFDWFFGDGGSSSATSPTYTYSTPGSYDICLYGYYSDSIGIFCDDSICYQVTVFQDSTGGGCVIGANVSSTGPYIIGNNTSTGSVYYEWTVADYLTGNQLTTSTTTNLYYSPGYAGDFLVCLIAYDDSTGNICDTLCQVVDVLQDSLDSVANYPSITFTDFTLYPNPTNAVLNIQFDHSPSKAHALIVDLLGREMIDMELSAQVNEIHVADFPRGVYIVQLLDADNQLIGMRKFIRE